MDAVYNRIRSIDTENNRWVVPMGTILLGAVVIGLAMMFVAPMFRRNRVEQLEDKGRGIKKRSVKRTTAAARQIKDAVEDVAETVQDTAIKMKKTAKKKIDQVQS